MTNTTWKFFSHFNRINMQRGSADVWTVHFRGTCYQGRKVVFNTQTVTVYNPKGQQPRAKIVGRAHSVVKIDDVILVG